MELSSLKSKKSLLANPSRWRPIILAPLSFGILAFAVFSTDFAQKIVPNPLAQANWIPHLAPNSSFSDQLYILFFRRGASSALDNTPSAPVPARPAVDGNFSVANTPGQPCHDQKSSDREDKGALAANSGERIPDKSGNDTRKGNFSSALQEALHGNPVDPRKEAVNRSPAKNVSFGNLPGDAVLNSSSAPAESLCGNDSYSREGNSSSKSGRRSGALKPNSTSADPAVQRQGELDGGSSQLSASPPLKHSIGHCDISVGRWVEDNSPPLYQSGACQFIDQGFSCQSNGRPDSNYTRWKWVPSGCEIPRLNGTRMLERLRGKRLLFVGDSLNRNQWESLVCILRESLANKTRVAEVHGGRTFKIPGAYSFKFQDYNCTLEFYTAPFLVNQVEEESGANFTVWLDRMDKTERKWRKADVLVFNTGHWWTKDKIRGGDMFREKATVHHNIDAMAAYRKAIKTWATWTDTYINATRTQVFFRGYSPSHYRGGQWNSGGQCHSETQPIFNESFINPYPMKMQVVEEVVSQMRVPVHILNITRLSEFRKDAHPAIYGHRPREIKNYQDCSHWCLPGLPDTWNELLSFALWTDN